MILFKDNFKYVKYIIAFKYIKENRYNMYKQFGIQLYKQIIDDFRFKNTKKKCYGCIKKNKNKIFERLYKVI